MEAVGLALEGYQLIDSGLSNEVVETSLNARAPFMRKLFALKWCLLYHHVDPVHCPVASVLEFLQDHLPTGLTPATLKVYLTGISAFCGEAFVIVPLDR